MKATKYLLAALLALCIFSCGYMVAEYEAPADDIIIEFPQAPAEQETEAAPTTEAAPQAPAENTTEEAPSITYILNKNSRKFHFPDCSSVKQMRESNKIYSYDDRDTIIANGYKYCQRCCP